jgi:type I restriction enzyme S subunit
MYRYAEIGDIDVTTGGIVFRQTQGYRLPTNRPSIAKHGDVLVSTVRTYRKGIGCVADYGDDLVTTNAVLNICGVTDFVPNLTLLYIYSFLRTDFFVEQVWSMLNRGLYPRMDKGALDKILIPISPDERVIRYVSVLMQAIVEKEKAIRDKSDLIHNTIQSELELNQKSRQFQHILPSISDLSSLQRLDAVIYDQEYKSKIWRVENYVHDSETPQQAGFTITPGPSLEIKIIRTRIDSDTYRPSYYTLILPTNISVYGTMNILPYLGTAKNLPLLKQGDIVFGEAGFQKGRSIVLLDHWPKCTTNAHGLYARRSDGVIQKAVFFRCIFNWYRTTRLIDIMAVGGSGGHFSPEYFDYVRIPKFPEDKQAEIVRLYHHDVPAPSTHPTINTFVDRHNRWNTDMGIWELAREMKVLQRMLSEVQDQIIAGKMVDVPI